MEGSVGTTLVAAAALAGRFYMLSVGDSALFHYQAKAGALIRCNQEHNYRLELMERAQRGEINMDVVLTHPERRALISYLGLKEVPRVELDRKGQPLQPKDRLLLCSDGVSGRLSPVALAALMSGDPARASHKIIHKIERSMALSQDNATAMIIACDTSQRPRQEKGLGSWVAHARSRLR